MLQHDTSPSLLVLGAEAQEGTRLQQPTNSLSGRWHIQEVPNLHSALERLHVLCCGSQPHAAWLEPTEAAMGDKSEGGSLDQPGDPI